MILKRTTTCAAVCAAALTALWLVAAPAHGAFLTPEYNSTLTGSGDHQIGNAAAVAVDQTTHDLYVADRQYHRVLKFDSVGNFLFMFGDGVNETTGGDKCPVSPTDVCRAGQQSSPTFPHFDDPVAIAVDNSDSTSKGSVYVSSGTVAKFDSSGNLTTGWASSGQLGLNGELSGFAIKMGVSPDTGYLWVIDGNWQVVAFDPDGTESVRTFSEPWNMRPGTLAVDAGENLYYGSYGGNPLKLNMKNFQETGAIEGIIYPPAGEGYALNPKTGDVLIDFVEEVNVFAPDCNPAAGYCIPTDSFGAGHLTGGEGLDVDAGSGTVYVATDEGVAIFEPLIIPDVTPKPSDAGHTNAVVSAHLDPLGAGDITNCEVEYGPTKAYGNKIPCDQIPPITEPIDATAEITGLTAEKTYHFRFLATNGNGTSRGPDQLVTPHWVKSLATGDATDIGPGAATLHGELNPDGELTHYYFEWGTTKSYGQKTPAAPGIETSASGLMPVEVSLDGLITSVTTYHYRIVASNSFGTSYGFDRQFTTPISDSPTVKGAFGTPSSLTSATLNAEVNPGFGDTAYMFQYGPDTSYGSKTLISAPIGNDGVFHLVSVPVTNLNPSTTYHFRIIAFNYNGYVQGEDTTFTTPSLPSIGATSASVLDARSARLSARVSGGSGATTVHFEYGPTNAYGTQTAETALGGDGEAAATVLGLSPLTTYHFRAIASNAFGQSVSPDQTFLTAGEPEAAQQAPRPKSCRKGFVRKKGKCVKRRRKHHRRRGARR